MNTCSDSKVSREEFLAAAQVLMQGLAQLMNDVQEDSQDEFITVREAAALLGLKHPEQVYPMIKSGRLTYRKVSMRGYRVSRASIEALTVKADTEGGTEE